MKDRGKSGKLRVRKKGEESGSEKLKIEKEILKEREFGRRKGEGGECRLSKND